MEKFIVLFICIVLLLIIFYKYVNKFEKLNKKINNQEKIVDCGCSHFNGECSNCDN